MNKINLKLSCRFCPEQYDVIYKEELIALIHLRYGRLTITPFNKNEMLVFEECEIIRDFNDIRGCFRNGLERAWYLFLCKLKIRKWIRNGRFK